MLSFSDKSRDSRELQRETVIGIIWMNCCGHQEYKGNMAKCVTVKMSGSVNLLFLLAGITLVVVAMVTDICRTLNR